MKITVIKHLICARGSRFAPMKIYYSAILVFVGMSQAFTAQAQTSDELIAKWASQNVEVIGKDAGGGWYRNDASITVIARDPLFFDGENFPMLITFLGTELCW